jgi:hypothetical protein
MAQIGEQGAYDLNLLLPEVEVWTNIWSDAPSHVTDWALSHNVRKTQMTRNGRIWRIIRIRTNTIFLTVQNKWDGWGFQPGTNIALAIVAVSAIHHPASSVSGHFIYIPDNKKQEHHRKNEIVQIHSCCI